LREKAASREDSKTNKPQKDVKREEENPKAKAISS